MFWSKTWPFTCVGNGGDIFLYINIFWKSDWLCNIIRKRWRRRRQTWYEINCEFDKYIPEMSRISTLLEILSGSVSDTYYNWNALEF